MEADMTDPYPTTADMRRNQNAVRFEEEARHFNDAVREILTAALTELRKLPDNIPTSGGYDLDDMIGAIEDMLPRDDMRARLRIQGWARDRAGDA